MTFDLIGQRAYRLEKLKTLRSLGIDPFPPHTDKSHDNHEVISSFDALQGEIVTVAGRLMSIREHGKVTFYDLADASGILQIIIKQDVIQADHSAGKLGWEDLSLFDQGDFVEAIGSVCKTNAGEISVEAQGLRMLAKAIRPLPERLEDKELRFRRRYVDLNVNPEVRERFVRKARFWHAQRQFMQERGFMEVETPVLEHVTGGADARPFETHHNDLDQDFFLRISTELYQKRLIGAGFEKIFTIGPNFRNEGVSDEHLQEYYQLEWYWAYADYRDNMTLVRDLFRCIANEVWGTTTFTTRGHTFDLSDEWEEIDYPEVIKEHFSVDIFKDSTDVLATALQRHGLAIEPLEANRNRIIDNLWKVIRKSISGPAFLINEPKFMSPLAKSKANNPELTERFHVVIGGSELGNGYSEINDPEDQLDRFLEQQAMRDGGDDEAQMLDIDYVEMLEYGMPPTSGYGQSERIFWFFEDVTAREGTLFPLMKPEISNLTKDVYPQVFTQNEVHSAISNDVAGLPNREEARKLLEEHVTSEYQRLHATMVADVLAAYAKELGENEDLWYITGLLHDLDYDVYPDDHPAKSLEWFSEWGYPEQLTHAIAAHAHSRTGVQPQTLLAGYLIATDELAGLLYAYSLMRSEGFEGMKLKSIKKKFKDKSFAAKVDREEIMFGVEKAGIDFDHHVMFLVKVFNQG